MPFTSDGPYDLDGHAVMADLEVMECPLLARPIVRGPDWAHAVAFGAGGGLGRLRGNVRHLANNSTSRDQRAGIPIRRFVMAGRLRCGGGSADRAVGAGSIRTSCVIGFARMLANSPGRQACPTPCHRGSRDRVLVDQTRAAPSVRVIHDAPDTRGLADVDGQIGGGTPPGSRQRRGIAIDGVGGRSAVAARGRGLPA